MNNTVLTIIGFSVIFLATTLGAALVFFFKKEISDGMNTLFLGFAAGIMLAASVWSLLIPSIEGAADYGVWKFIPAATGFIAGGAFLVVLDWIAQRVYPEKGASAENTVQQVKPFKMFLAMTIHNVPEGLAVGFAFGGASGAGTAEASFVALWLAIGIAVQNFPEGAAVSLPLKSVYGSNLKSFAFGAGSGAVEPIAAAIGFLLATTLSAAQPWLLSFAAGAMVFVVVEDIIPDAKYAKKPHLGTWSAMFGFAIMMVLDVAMG